jgi:hypothetical protein
MAAPSWIVGVYESPLVTSIRESEVLFPVLQTFHIFGIILLAGGIIILDLRLLKLILRGQPPAVIAGSILPVAWIGFALVAVSGIIELVAESATLYSNTWLRIKAVLLLLALLNIALAHATAFRSVRTWANDSAVPSAARGFAAASILLWAGVVVAGRFIAFL